MYDMDAAAVAAELGRVSGESGDQAGFELCQRAKSLIEEQSKQIGLLEADVRDLASRLEITTVSADKLWCRAESLRLAEAEREVLHRARQEFPEDIVRRDPTTGESLWTEVAAVIDALLERHAKGR